MRLLATLAIARKDALEVILNRSALLTVLSPLLGAALFAILASLLGGRTASALVYDPDRVLAALSAAGSPLAGFEVHPAASAAEVALAFEPGAGRARGPYAVGLVIPVGFDDAVRAGRQPALDLYFDGQQVGPEQQRTLAGAVLGWAAERSGWPLPAQVSVHGDDGSTPTPWPSLGRYLAMFGLVAAFIVGAALAAGLMLEEKERHTLRLLRSAPVTWGDIGGAKLLVALGYQLAVAAAVLAIQGGFTGQRGWLVLFVGLGCAFSLALGFLFGSLVATTASFGAFLGVVSVVLTVPALFVGPLGTALDGSLVVRAVQVFPTYYLASGIFSAMEGALAASRAIQEAGILLAATLALSVAAVWTMRRSAADGQTHLTPE